LLLHYQELRRLNTLLEPRWQVQDSNLGRHTPKESAEKGIVSVKTSAPGATVVDQTSS